MPREVDDGDGGAALGVGAVAELPAGVEAPALDGAVGEASAGVEAPAAMETALAMPVTATGVVRWVVVPSPSCPLALRPQHLTVPPWMRAQA
jgi:hypothetical protein